MKRLIFVFVILMLATISCKNLSEKKYSSDNTEETVKMINYLEISVANLPKYFLTSNESGKVIKAVIEYNENGNIDENLPNRMIDISWKERILLLNNSLK